MRDLAAIVGALQLGRVDYYGDSYGSFFGQVFASRYPQLLRSVVLDSTYPTIDQDPFDRAGLAEIRFGFNAVCERSLACSAQAPGSSIDRLHRLADALDRRRRYRRVRRTAKVHVHHPAGSPTSSRGRPATTTGLTTNILPPRVHTSNGRRDPPARLFVDDVPRKFGVQRSRVFVGWKWDSCTVYRDPFDISAPIRRSSRASPRRPSGSAIAELWICALAEEAYDE